MSTRFQQDWQGEPKPNPIAQGKPMSNPQPAGGTGSGSTAEGKAELSKLGVEKAGRVRDFLDRKG